MALFLVAYLGGALTLLSPCILPVLPFLLARADQPWLTVRLPMLAGMALLFAAVAVLAAVGANWVIRANEYGRYLAMLVLLVFGLALLWPGLADWLGWPAQRLGEQLSEPAAPAVSNPGDRVATVIASLVLGAATGLLWTPCAGPILGLLLSAAAWQGASLKTALLLLAYAAGAATALGLGMAASGRLLAALRRISQVGVWLRRGLGVAVLAGVASIATGAALNPASPVGSPNAATERLENTLLAATGTAAAPAAAVQDTAVTRPYRSTLPVEGRLPALDGAVEWLNSPPLTAAQLRGKVVLVDFWTYSCINCIRTLPYVRAWYQKYKDQGLVVIGVHAPEFAFEKNVGNVRKALGEFRLDYPIAVDNDFRLWRAFGNSYWPALYLVDADGRIRYHQFGEGSYDTSEAAIQALLKEAGSARTQAQGSAQVAASVPAQAALTKPEAPGIEAAPDLARLASDETYLGYRQSSGFASPERVRSDSARDYSAAPLRLNQWSLSGNWQVNADDVTLQRSGGSIAYRFRARDLHLILGPAQDGVPVRFQVSVDGQPPGPLHGADTDANGNGTVTRTRLFQLVRQRTGVQERNFEVRFLDPGVHAYAFTFG